MSSEKKAGNRFKVRKQDGGPLGPMWSVLDTHDRSRAVVSCGGPTAKERAKKACDEENAKHDAAQAKAGGAA